MCEFCKTEIPNNLGRHVRTKHPEKTEQYIQQSSRRPGKPIEIKSLDYLKCKQEVWRRKSARRQKSRGYGAPIHQTKVPKEVVQAFNESNKIVFFIGAGLSVASGIAPFRGEHGIHGSKITPSGLRGKDLFTKRFSWNSTLTAEFLKGHSQFYKQCTEAMPNGAHHWIRFLVETGKCHQVFNQNVDLLFERLDFGTKLFSVHKSYGNFKCSLCDFKPDVIHQNELNEKFLAQQVDEFSCPRILSTSRKTKCKGTLIPDLLYFDDVENEFQGIFNPKIAKCDLIVIIGTSLEIPAFRQLIIFYQSKNPKSKLVFVNPTPREQFKKLNLRGLEIDHWVEMKADDFAKAMW